MEKEERKIPQHVAIIMDGNGRWAKKARTAPYHGTCVQGARVVEQILEDADHMGIRYLTVYAFSTENWSRPDAEVKALMNLLRTYMKTSLVKCMPKTMCGSVIIGDKSNSVWTMNCRRSIKNLEDIHGREYGDSVSRSPSTTAAGTRSCALCGRLASR
jgi:undecaprenyl diphosphate synthase